MIFVRSKKNDFASPGPDQEAFKARLPGKIILINISQLTLSILPHVGHHDN